MLRLGVVIAAWFVAWTALAQEQLVVADSASTPDAVRSLVSLLGPGTRVALEPALASLDDVLAWAASEGATIAVVVAVDQRRVFVAIPSTHRVIERVLPDDVTASEPYAIAIAASELVELARWGDEATLDAAAAVSIPEHSEPPVPDGPVPDELVPDEPDEAPPENEQPPPPRELPGRVAWSLGLGVGARVGLDRALVCTDLEARFDGLVVGREGAGPWTFFFGGGLRGGFPARHRDEAGLQAVALRYSRPELDLRAGPAFVRARVSVRPSLRLSLAWVHVHAAIDGVPKPTATDDRVAWAIGTGVEVRYRVLEHGFLGVDLGVDTLGARAPYVAFGRTVLREPYLRVTLGLFAGITLPR